MYLIIHPDGDVYHSPGVSESDKDSADRGEIDLICIADSGNPRRYDAGEWNRILDRVESGE